MGANCKQERVRAGGFGDTLAGAAAEYEDWLGFFRLESGEDDDVQTDFAAGSAIAIFPDRVGGAEKLLGCRAGMGFRFFRRHRTSRRAVQGGGENDATQKPCRSR
jgi:hypothetical protein